MSDLKFIVTTYDHAMWALHPFAYLFNIYWSAQQPITALVESQPKLSLPSNFDIHVIDVDGEGWPKEKWTDGFIKYLNGIKEQYIVILLEDYWLDRKVDTEGVRTLHEYMTFHPKVIRFDLTMDRLYAGGPQYPIDDLEYDQYGHYDILIRPDTQYQMSLQAGIFNKGLLLNILHPGWSPWDVELLGTGLINESDMIVLGTRQNPVSYVNALKNELEAVDTFGIPREHLREIEEWIEW